MTSVVAWSLECALYVIAKNRRCDTVVGFEPLRRQSKISQETRTVFAIGHGLRPFHEPSDPPSQIPNDLRVQHV